MKSKTAVSMLLFLAGLQQVLVVNSRPIPHNGGQPGFTPSSNFHNVILKEYCKRIEPRLRPAFCYEVLAGKRMTPAKLEKLYAQYKGTVSAKDQMRDLQSARRVLAR